MRCSSKIGKATGMGEWELGLLGALVYMEMSEVVIALLCSPGRTCGVRDQLQKVLLSHNAVGLQCTWNGLDLQKGGTSDDSFKI